MLLTLCTLGWMLAQAVEPGETTLVDFGAEELPGFVVRNDVILERTPHEGGYAAKIRFDVVNWPNVLFRAPEGEWDWSAYTGVAVSLRNPTDESVRVCMRVDNAGADGTNHCNNATGGVPPHGRYVLSLRFNTGKAEALWGMRGVPGCGPLGSGPVIDASKITAFQVFLPQPQEEHTLLFERAWLFGKGGDTESLAPMPFVDPFGQYIHGDWPGKLKRAEELGERRTSEEAQRGAHPELPGRDAYGGWAEGPQLEATGWFRTEEVDGKWWLVTPEGHLFFSVGVDCLGTWERTFIQKREDWFSWLPGEDEPDFAALLSYNRNAHSGSEIIGGEGRTFSFYCANLIRKYGPETWQADWREAAYARLKEWGFNTIGNWSQGDVLQNSPMPFVVSTGTSQAKPIEGATGYWGKMKDVYDPSFLESAEAAFGWAGKTFGNNPRCIGYFVDNELSWEGVSKGALNSSPRQACRNVLVKRLKEKYTTLEALNEAWETDAADWDSLRQPSMPNSTVKADLDAFLYDFARCYFETIKRAGRAQMPHQLYLGCRFSTAPEPAVRAAAEVCDVVSYNLYYRRIPQDRWVGEEDLNAPIIIGEFHFGALDRGMFHTGLVATADQEERAAHYARYVRSVADHPAFVGCHWFQFIDEPNTGRWFDGENYNIGFLDVTDTPYPELVAAAKQVHAKIYERRYGGKK